MQYTLYLIQLITLSAVHYDITNTSIRPTLRGKVNDRTEAPVRFVPYVALNCTLFTEPILSKVVPDFLSFLGGERMPHMWCTRV
jgi:hypothetical protein